MNKLLLILLFILPISTHAQEDNFSGVYQEGSDFFSIHHIGNQIVLAALDTMDGDWEAYEGKIIDYTATLYSVYAPGTAVIEIKFFPLYARLNLLSCTAAPGAECTQTIGYSATLRKIM